MHPQSGSHPKMAEPRAVDISPPLPLVIALSFPIVAIGASAGGLEACKKLLNALPSPTTAWPSSIVQHLDPEPRQPAGRSCSARTRRCRSSQAADGMAIEREQRLCHSARRLSLGRRQGRRCGFPRRAERHGARLAVRLPAEFAGRRLSARAPSRSSCRAPAPTAARVEGGQGEGRVRHRAGTGRGRL